MKAVLRELFVASPQISSRSQIYDSISFFCMGSKTILARYTSSSTESKSRQRHNEQDQVETLCEEPDVKGGGGVCCAVGGTHLHTFMMWEESV